MRYFSKYFLVALALFVANQLMEAGGVFIPFVHSYLDDFLAPGVILGFTLAFQQQFTFREKDYRFSAGHAVVFVLWYSLLFELLLPLLHSRYYADIWDVAAYTLGSIVFMKMGNRPARKLIPLRRIFQSG